MAVSSRHLDRERLEREIGGEGYGEMLRQIQQGTPFLRQFRTWTEVLAFMRGGTSRDPAKDEILRPIFLAHREDSDPRWRTILLAFFWPALESISWQRRRWDDDPEELWCNLTWAFLEVACRIDIQKRPDRLVQKVFNSTVHRLYDTYRRTWSRLERETNVDPENLELLAGGSDGIDISGIELQEAREIGIRRLRAHLEQGRISEADFLLLVGTRVYGKSVADYARETGLDYQVAKKRRQRAEATIRDSEQEA